MAKASQLRPRYHVSTVMHVAGIEWPLRVVITEQGPLRTLIEYYLARDRMSRSWYAKTTSSVGLLYDFFRSQPPWNEETSSSFLSDFARALRFGTEIVDAPWCTRPGLFWPPQTIAKQRQVLTAVTQFGDWLAQHAGTKQLNPRQEATFDERMAEFRRLERRSAASLLKHLGNRSTRWKASRAAGRSVPLPRIPIAVHRRPPFFPLDHVEDLFRVGFRIRDGDGPFWQTHDVRGIMIAMLQLFGGLRASEPLHLFVSDVTTNVQDVLQPDGGADACVWLYHPSEGRCPEHGQYRSRTEYLWQRFGRVPRNLMTFTPEHSGWKELLLTDAEERRTRVWWVPPFLGTSRVRTGALFWSLFSMYVAHVRPRGLRHPYLFVNTRRDSSSFGGPYRLASWQKAFRRAVERIGLQPAKNLGTTTHGLRHAYGQMLKWHGVDDKLSMILMHHKHIGSQDVYKRSSVEELEAALAQAFAIQRATTAPLSQMLFAPITQSSL